MCGVDSPDHCPAARRAQTQRFADSEALDACPKLRGRAQGRCSAVCVPMSIMGRTVGVIHTTGTPGTPLDDSRIDDLETLANQAGARLGMLRVMAETQLQASTDSLTGLINRRSAEEQMRSLLRTRRPFALALGVSQAWSEQFASLFRTQAAAGYAPAWYDGDRFDADHLGRFSTSLSDSFDSAVSSASTPPGDSSGSSSSGGGGGSSGGGGGGGGGGGW